MLLYFDKVDKAGHEGGPGSEQVNYFNEIKFSLQYLTSPAMNGFKCQSDDMPVVHCIMYMS